MTLAAGTTGCLGTKSPMDESSFAIAVARLEEGGILRVAMETLAGANIDDAEDSRIRPQEMPAGIKWLYIRRECLFSLDGVGELGAIFSDGGGAASFPILLKNEEAKRLLLAARAFEAEREARRYLFRAEHTRFMLERKLIQKGFSAKEAAPALDFLEREKILDDRRFALAWLNTRVGLHPEGRAALAAALFERGVSREDADAAIAAFFATHDEEELCLRAAQKLMRRGRVGDKLVSSLCRAGFPVRMALRVAKEALG